MLLLRSYATLGSGSARPFIILIISAIICFLFAHDASAGGLPEAPRPSIPDAKSLDQWINKEVRLGNIRRSDSTDPFSGGVGGVLSKPVKLGEPLGGRKPFYLLNTDSKALSSRKPELKISWAEVKPLAVSELFKPTFISRAGYRIAGGEGDSNISADFLLPTKLSPNSSLFLESRAEFQSPFANNASPADRRYDVSMGLGWRKTSLRGLMVGANAFLDVTRLAGEWYRSPGFGVESAAHWNGGAWDLVLNAYQGGGIDAQTGFTFPIMDKRLDMRIFAEKYRFFDGDFILGSKGGFEVSSPNRLVNLSYAYGQDSECPAYHAVSCSMNVPFSLEKLFSGKNPIEIADRPSQDNRYIERLQSDSVKRTWRSPTTVVEARATPQGKRWTTPGKLTDTMFCSQKPSTETAKTETTSSSKLKDCECEKTKKSSGCKISGDELLGLGLLFGGLKIGESGLGKACAAVGATYLGADYSYRNAFGPFEIEPYEREEIKKEMSKIKRRK
jgi:hypothetical protein